MAATHSLSRWGAAQAHIAELDVFSEEEPAICGHGTQPPPPQSCHSHQTHMQQHTQYLKKIIKGSFESWKKDVMSQGQFPSFETIMCPFCDCEERKRPCRNPLEKQNNPTIETPFDWWVGQTQLKGMLWLITSCPVTARQSAAQRHSRHSKPHHFPLKFLSHLPLVLVYFEAAFRSGLSSKDCSFRL